MDQAGLRSQVEIADRETVENGIDEILDAAVTESVALIVVGDPFRSALHSLAGEEGFIENHVMPLFSDAAVAHRASHPYRL